MLAMPEIHHIKHLREKKGLSLSEIVRRTGFNWRTVKKYADGDISVGQKIKRKRGMMDTVKSLMTGWRRTPNYQENNGGQARRCTNN